MTGELFAVLKEHSILGRLMQGEADDHAAFERGLAYARAGGGGLLRRLFSARTLGLFDLLPESGVASYLSGLLIGSEIDEALACLEVRAGCRDPRDRRFAARLALSRRACGAAICACGRRMTMRAPGASS